MVDFKQLRLVLILSATHSSGLISIFLTVCELTSQLLGGKCLRKLIAALKLDIHAIVSPLTSISFALSLR